MKILKKMVLFFGVLLFFLVTIIAFFINISPEFEGSPTKEQKALYIKSKNYKGDVFVNHR